MMLDLNSLNREQRLAVTTTSGPLMILAGAGTGKTRVITYRIAHLLHQGVPPNHIAAMTFTNKAAKEMKERLIDLVGPKKAAKLSISTFHSFCLNILRKTPTLAAIKEGFSLAGTSDQIDFVRKALEELKWQGLYKPEDMQSQISMCKNWLISPEELVDGSAIQLKQNIKDPHVLAACYKQYERQLTLNRAIDFDDCIFKVVKMLRIHPDLKSHLAQKFRYILVDEFQDTNSSQFETLKLLVPKNGNICVVGDDDQSIYSWRGAMYETIELFEQHFENTCVIKLEQNYRCTDAILDCANQVIKNNAIRKKKTLWSKNPSHDPIIVKSCEDAQSEARWVAQKALTLHAQNSRLSDIAVLYRANSQAKAIEMALRECSLKYKTFGGQSFFERKEVKDYLSYIRLALNPNDHLSLWRVINTPPRGIGFKTQEKIEHLAHTHKKSPYATMLTLNDSDIDDARAMKAIRAFCATMESLRAIPLAEAKDIKTLAESTLSQVGLIEHLRLQIKNQIARQQKTENLKAIPNWLEKISLSLQSEKGEINKTALIDSLTLDSSPSDQSSDEDSNFISLMSIHAAKGLEFRNVFLVGCEEGSMPHKNSIGSHSSVAEERRLFYVALTRAKIRLFLTYAHLRKTGFTKEIRSRSRFLLELPKTGGSIQWDENHNELENKDNRKRSTLKKLSALRESLTL